MGADKDPLLGVMRGFNCATCGDDVKAERRCTKPPRAPLRHQRIAAMLDARVPDRPVCDALVWDDMPEAYGWLALYTDYKRGGLTWTDVEAFPLRDLAALRLIDTYVAEYSAQKYKETTASNNAQPRFTPAAPTRYGKV